MLLQLTPNARPEQVKFAISQIAGVKVVEGNALLTSSRQALRSLLAGVAVFAGAGALAILILVSLLFSAIVQEQTRELGLLRALGARPNHVVAMVLAEAGMIAPVSAGWSASCWASRCSSRRPARSASTWMIWTCRSAGRRSRRWRRLLRPSSWLRQRWAWRAPSTPAWQMQQLEPLALIHRGRAMILAARSLTKRWSSFTAVNTVDLSLAEGEFVSIVGRSGSASRPCSPCWAR